MNITCMSRGNLPPIDDIDKLKSDLHSTNCELAKYRSVQSFYIKKYDQAIIELAELHSQYGLLEYKFEERFDQCCDLKREIENLKDQVETLEETLQTIARLLGADFIRSTNTEKALKIATGELDKDTEN